MEEVYKENDGEFKKLYNIQEAEEAEEVKEAEEAKEAEFEGENEAEEDEDEEDKNEINIYHKKDFQLDKVLNFFFNKDIIVKVQFCPKCGKPMKLENNKNYMDEKVWRCRSKVTDHDEKKISGKIL